MCDRKDDKDAEQEPEGIGDEAFAEIFAKEQDKTATFSYPGLIMPSDDSEDERSTPRRRISRIKARSKYLRSIQQFWPKFPHTRSAMSSVTTGGHGSA
jgi:hypothetical protein